MGATAPRTSQTGPAGWLVGLVAAVAALAGAPGAASAVDVPGKRVELQWPAASGPVLGYAAFVYRNGSKSPELPPRLIDRDRRRLAIEGERGERVVVRVAAFDHASRFGPLSAPSPEIRFVGGKGPKGSGGGSGGASGGKARGSAPKGVRKECAFLLPLRGVEKLRVRGLGRSRSHTDAGAALCSGEWWGIEGRLVAWAGEYQHRSRKGSGSRKLDLGIDRETEAWIRAVLADGLQAEALERVRVRLRGTPRLRVERNGAGTRVSWKVLVKFEARRVSGGEWLRGTYRLATRGRLDRASARALEP